MDTLSDFTLFQKHLLLKCWLFTTVQKSPKKDLNLKLNSQVHSTRSFTTNLFDVAKLQPMENHWKGIRTAVIPPLHSFLWILYCFWNTQMTISFLFFFFFRSHLPTSLPTVTCTEPMLVCITLLLAEASGHKLPDPFLPRVTSEQRYAPHSWEPTVSEQTWNFCGGIHENHLSWELLTERTGDVMTAHLYTCL